MAPLAGIKSDFSSTTGCGYRIKFGGPLLADIEMQIAEHCEADFIIFLASIVHIRDAANVRNPDGMRPSGKASAANLPLAEVPKAVGLPCAVTRNELLV